MPRTLTVFVLLIAATAHAGPPVLEAHQVGGITISTPRGWDFAGDADKVMVLARQDPKRTDGAQLVVIVSTASTVTEDQVLDALAAQVAQNVKVIQRGAGPGKAGKMLVADGKIGALAVRLGAIAIGANGGMVVGLLAAKSSDFTALGGIDLVTAVIASMHATTGPEQPAASASTGSSDEEEMVAQYQYGYLVVPPITKPITIANLVGKWSTNAGSASVHGNSGGVQSSVNSAEEWTIDAKGGFTSHFKAAVTQNRNTRGVDEVDTGRAYFDQAGELVIATDHGTTYYAVHGWFHNKDVTAMRISTPYYKPIDPKILADVNYNHLLDHTLYRTR